jgi:hypothetical protein
MIIPVHRSGLVAHYFKIINLPLLIFYGAGRLSFFRMCVSKSFFFLSCGIINFLLMNIADF